MANHAAIRISDEHFADDSGIVWNIYSDECDAYAVNRQDAKQAGVVFGRACNGWTHYELQICEDGDTFILNDNADLFIVKNGQWTEN